MLSVCVPMQLVGVVAALLFLARRIEPVWGSREFLAFVCGVNASTGAATLALCYVAYMINARSEHAGAVLYALSVLCCLLHRVTQRKGCIRIKYDISCRASSPLLCRYMEVAGFQGIIAACLVAVKQVMPEDEITVLSFIRFRAKVSAVHPILVKSSF